MPDINMSNHRISNPPCKDCADREVGCHSTCKAYIEWVKYEKTKYEIVNSRRSADYIATDYSITGVEKRKKGLRKWHRNRRG